MLTFYPRKRLGTRLLSRRQHHTIEDLPHPARAPGRRYLYQTAQNQTAQIMFPVRRNTEAVVEPTNQRTISPGL
jgi:hypothetical protein